MDEQEAQMEKMLAGMKARHSVSPLIQLDKSPIITLTRAASIGLTRFAQ
jgi:hypothetical protein